ncbi:MAG: cobalamin-dependent protein [Desulfobacterota bacterium]|nr:cobalamin-dependent protein [Thermodesulfobacteriota bacterium]MDW8002585.1 cobalamin-dependent protein [Deltaproteobacteria bacterium]
MDGVTKKRIIMAKMGLDAHDNALRIVSKWLKDSGYEIIYAGLYNSPEKILKMVIEEDADAIGLSFHGGEHLYHTSRLIELLKTHNLTHIKIFVGGIIAPFDVEKLKKMGVSAVFTPGSRKEDILNVIKKSFDEN